MLLSKRWSGFLVCLLITTQCFTVEKFAIFKYPVTTLISNDIGCDKEQKKFLTTYSPQLGAGCFRSCQGLFGEFVKVDIDQKFKNDWVKVTMCHCYFGDKNKGKNPIALTYLVKREDIVLFDDMNKDIQQLFAPPILYTDPKSVSVKDVVTLALPWKCEQNGQIYSAGTRFKVLEGEKNNTESKKIYSVMFFDPVKTEVIKDVIPARLLVNHGVPISSETDRRKLFVKLLKKWCKNSEGFIPYVWGGASFTKQRIDKKFVLMTEMVGSNKIQYWKYENGDSVPYGFDCSMLVLRAAQACGIPYFSRTAGTAAAILEQVLSDQKIEPGDLCVTEHPNHIFVFTGDDDDMIIEAAGYSSGYGKVHKIPISKRFTNVKKCSDFLDLNKKNDLPVYLAVDGTNSKPFSFSILRLPV